MTRRGVLFSGAAQSRSMVCLAVVVMTASSWLVSFGVAAPILKQVQIVTRHGARTPLPKTALVQENNDPVLTPLGQREHYDLGVFLRQSYTGLQVIDTYNESLTTFYSSYYARTIVSAQSLALGLFPDRGASLLPANVTPSNIPIHLYAAQHDIKIRAYENCPAYKQNLNALYQTESWTEYQSSHMVLLKALAEIPYFAPYANFGTYVLLSQVWNVYDAIQVSKTECGLDNSSEFCIKYSNPTLVNILSDAQWTELKTVAQFAELTKYGIPTAKNLLGSNILADILVGMGTDFNETTPVVSPALTFRMYSAHYPTLLSIFAALQVVFKDFDGIPNYASALIFELWEDEASESFVRILFKDGFSSVAKPVVLGNECGGVVNCSLNNFTALLSGIVYKTPGAWCTDCNNTSADVCVQQLLSVAQSQLAAVKSVTCSKDDGFSKGALAGSFFGGVGAMLVLFIVGYFLWSVFGRNSSPAASRSKPVTDETNEFTDPVA